MRKSSLRHRQQRRPSVTGPQSARNSYASPKIRIARNDDALAYNSVDSASNSQPESDHVFFQPPPRISHRTSTSPPKTMRYDSQSHMFLHKQLHVGGSSEDTTCTMLREPETHPITAEQLATESKGIYSGLVMVEKKCIDIHKQQSQSGIQFTKLQWQALTAIHRTLLHEHHDFFLASQHPSASPYLKGLAESFVMPARMWRYGIHSYLELLRNRLPDSYEHMLTFIYLAYSMMTLLLESVPKFEEIWIECLGDLARYRMAVEGQDMQGRETWAGVARYWYNKVADRNPQNGRIQHHLGVLARPDDIQQLFYYTKSLVSVEPFMNTRDSICLLFNPLLERLEAQGNYDQCQAPSAFIGTHSILFTKGCTGEFKILGNCFLSQFGAYIGHVGSSFRLHGAYIMSCNFAAILEYGHENALLPAEFNSKALRDIPFQETYKSATEYWRSSQPAVDPSFDSHLQFISYASYFAFLSLSTILLRGHDANIFPAVNLSLSFIWCSALNCCSKMRYIEDAVPWNRLASFLNSLLGHAKLGKMDFIEREVFPVFNEGAIQQLPEDFIIRGQAWAQLYFPMGFFDKMEEDTRTIEFPYFTQARVMRCIWLGGRIASVCYLSIMLYACILFLTLETDTDCKMTVQSLAEIRFPIRKLYGYPLRPAA